MAWLLHWYGLVQLDNSFGLGFGCELVRARGRNSDYDHGCRSGPGSWIGCAACAHGSDARPGTQLGGSRLLLAASCRLDSCHRGASSAGTLESVTRCGVLVLA